MAARSSVVRPLSSAACGLLARARHATTSPYAINGLSCYHADGNGNVTYLASSTGTADAAYQYDPFGRTLASPGGYATANVYRFSSNAFHAPSGLYYYGYRFYDPNTQRWLGRDPLGDWEIAAFVAPTAPSRSEKSRAAGHTTAVMITNGGLETWTRANLALYGALGNNPISNTDPLGLDFATCYVDCMERYRSPLTEQVPNWIASKVLPGFEVWPYSGAMAYSANALANELAGPTGRTGVGGKKPHPTSWQHKLGSKFGKVLRGRGGTAIGRIGKALGRGAVYVTVGEGFYDIGLQGGCVAACALE